ncbi:MAG: hypothetical protein U0Z75_00510 [Deinococcaceae bacterium]
MKWFSIISFGFALSLVSCSGSLDSGKVLSQTQTLQEDRYPPPIDPQDPNTALWSVAYGVGGSSSLHYWGIPTEQHASIEAGLKRKYTVGATFDQSGTLWTVDQQTLTILGFKSGVLKPGLDAVPDIVLSAPNGTLDHPRDLAFDRQGNLYVANAYKDNILRFEAKSLTKSGVVVPTLTIESTQVYSKKYAPYSISIPNQPNALAFDEKGDLWVGDARSNLLRYSIAEIDKMVARGAVTMKNPPEMYHSARGSISSLAFDKAGNLWLGLRSNFDRNRTKVYNPLDETGSVVQYSKKDLSSVGEADISATYTYKYMSPEDLAITSGNAVVVTNTLPRHDFTTEVFSDHVRGVSLPSGKRALPDSETSARVGAMSTALWPIPKGLPLKYW